MNESGSPDADLRPPLDLVTWVVIAVLCLFTVENLWIDPWLKHVSHSSVSFAPQRLGGAWMLITSMMGIALVLLIVSQILLWREAGSTWQKTIARVVGVSVTAVLCATWFLSTTSGQATRQASAPPPPKPHSVTLHWHASRTAGVEYNVYRKTRGKDKDYVKLNNQPLSALTYIDQQVKSGETYSYVTRSIDGKHNESLDSNEVQVTVP